MLISRGSLTPPSLLSLQKQRLSEIGKRDVYNRKGESKCLQGSVGNIWRLATITSRQEDFHSIARTTSYDELHILVGILSGAWRFAKSSVATRRGTITLKQYLIPVSARTFGKKQRLHAPL
uniref:Uncharacterized protein n=1 Tax=Micrurus lemniscatus lemniscatus TaxID=129467 RepID=A0A2D4JKH8_MICLE